MKCCLVAARLNGKPKRGPDCCDCHPRHPWKLAWGSKRGSHRSGSFDPAGGLRWEARHGFESRANRGPTQCPTLPLKWLAFQDTPTSPLPDFSFARLHSTIAIPYISALPQSYYLPAHCTFGSNPKSYTSCIMLLDGENNENVHDGLTY